MKKALLQAQLISVKALQPPLHTTSTLSHLHLFLSLNIHSGNSHLFCPLLRSLCSCQLEKQNHQADYLTQMDKARWLILKYVTVTEVLSCRDNSSVQQSKNGVTA